MTDAAATAASELRTKQKPLKEKYRNSPESAFITLSSSSSLNDPSSSPSCSLSTSNAARRVAGLHPAAGGPGAEELCSGDMLLESLVACFGVTIRAVSTSLAIPINSGTVTAEGDLDFRGTLGIKDQDNPEKSIPVGFTGIRLNVRLDVDEDHKSKVDKLIQLSERYCVVLQTLKSGVSVETKIGNVGKALPDTRDNAELSKNGTDTTNGANAKPQEDETVEKSLSNEEVLQLN